MKYRVGDIGNGMETSEQTIEAENYIDVLEKMLEAANLYCHVILEITRDEKRKIKKKYGKSSGAIMAVDNEIVFWDDKNRVWRWLSTERVQ